MIGILLQVLKKERIDSSTITCIDTQPTALLLFALSAKAIY